MEDKIDIDMHEIEVKEEPFLIEGILNTEFKSEPEETWGSDVSIKSESGSLNSVFIAQPEHEIVTKTEIEEEPDCLNQTSTEQKSEPEGVDLNFLTEAMQEVYQALEKYTTPNSLSPPKRKDPAPSPAPNLVKGVDGTKRDPVIPRHKSPSGPKSTTRPLRPKPLPIIGVMAGVQYLRWNVVSVGENILREDQKLLLSESTRLVTEAAGNFEPAVIRAGINGSLKPTENSNPCVKANTTPALGTNTTQMFSVHNNECQFCGKCYSSKSNLQSHVVTHQGIRKHCCSICGRSYLIAKYLKEHMLTHEPKGRYKCDKCGKHCFTASRLKSHKVMHEEKKVFKCKLCERSFLRATTLKSHIQVHSGERPFKCDKCDKSFGRLGGLKNHYFIHEGKKPYKCTKCEKGFTQSSQLKAHMLIHEDKRLHKCSICDKSFIQASNLRSHKLIHEGKRPHVCGSCGKSFTRNTHLKGHIKIVHENKSPEEHL